LRARYNRRSTLKLVATAATLAIVSACGDGTGPQTGAPVASHTPTTPTAPNTPVIRTTVPDGPGSSGMSPLSTTNPAVKGVVRQWQTPPDDPSLPSAKYHREWIASLKITLPNVSFIEEQMAYADMLDKLRIAARAGQQPDTAVVAIQWSPELAANGWLQELHLTDFGYHADTVWPTTLPSVMWQGALYGIPTRMETMVLFYNKEIFQRAGLDPDAGPDTWEDVQAFTRQIRDKTGKASYGMVAKPNSGNTPYRFMPLSWAYGGAVLDETAETPKLEASGLDNDGNIAALHWMLDMYRNGHAPPSSLTNTQTEIRNLFLAGEVAMMIDSPVVYKIVQSKAPDLAEKMNAVLIPRGPVRRAVAFGGWNIVMFRGAKDRDAAKAVIQDFTSPLWSLRHSWETSNPGNRDALLLPEQQQRLRETRFLNVTAAMLPYGISWPAIPENADITNLLIPEMIQDVLTQTKTPEQSAKDTARKVNELIGKRR